ncbi:23S rRNA (uracil(1939)-C(5))-methyltransferase RlmD [Alkalicoccus halolimnae]|uniref:23S rRNA (Uracil(1939)-C(5))-methyltransferase RlmD n=1 Tax=Alkalicoccus halolimnae TaxID=1667239 RepID=A0A5C7FFW0_9BACI|nr:23S rRNA (uracil(1939)-C(5))-methyltransferase RlmD [Alkalicoccus halolimnae]TXF85124.1 23S rRNA (uracil(1939)-C(5))-methyltransferase RlmD [Alkalicoccus halolimnae]
MSDTQKVTITKGQKFPLTIKRLGIDGEGVGFFKRQVVFVPGALPGEEIVCEVVKVSHKFAAGRIVKIRKRSPDRMTAPCPFYDKCGGCQLQHLNYNGQLREKKDIVRQAFERYTKIPLESIEFHDTLGMENPWRYRNKSQMQAGRVKNKVIAGLYERHSNRLLDIDECIVQHPQTDKVTNIVKEIASDLRLTVYDTKKHKGFLRTIVTRTGFETGEYQLVIVTAEKDFPKKDLFIDEVKRKLPDITSIVQNINTQKTPLVFGNETIVLSGKERIRESLNGMTFELSARAFFQLNPEQTKVLYNAAKKAAHLTGKEKVIDAYCGTGTIGLWTSDLASEVRGMDVVEEAVADAKQNAERNGLSHVSFETGTAESVIPRWEEEGWKADVVIVDPPRTGLDKKLLHTLIQSGPERIVYVSCNPSTLAKNVTELSEGGYRLESLQPVDMFPQTSQVETIAALKKR